jgi:hypothetical protein
MSVLVNLSQYDTLDRMMLFEQANDLTRHAEEHLTKEQFDDIHSFTFRDAYLGEGESFTQDTHHNAVRLKSGDVIPIPSWPRPEIPGHTNVTVTQKTKVAT